MTYNANKIPFNRGVGSLVTVLALLTLAGCANDKPLGVSVAQLKQEQTYNPNASVENKDVIPTGTGARSQVAYDIYSGQTEQGIQGSLLEPMTTDISSD